MKIKNVQMFNGAWPGPSKASVKAFVLAASIIVVGKVVPLFNGPISFFSLSDHRNKT